MDRTTLLAYLAFVGTAITVAINVWQAVRKRNQENEETHRRNEELKRLAEKATGERDSFVVLSAEKNLIMMERMLSLATTEGDKLRALLAEKESKIQAQEQKIRELEYRIAELERLERTRTRREQHNGDAASS